jgi:hypothetical protein
VRDTVGVGEPAIPRETIQHKRKSLIAFNIAWTLEEFIQHRADQILRRWDKARHRDLVGKSPVNETVVVCEVNVHFHV